MGRTPEQARASLRLSVGWGVDEAQVDRAVALLSEFVPRVREANRSRRGAEYTAKGLSCSLSIVDVLRQNIHEPVFPKAPPFLHP